MARYRLIFAFVMQVAIANGTDLITRIIESAGYPSETHQVVTSDGYVLTLHRIPPKNVTRKPEVFLLMHGLIGSSGDFILPGKDRGLGCILHDAGYDVWLPNSRGNTWSKKHSQYSSFSREFWDFSWHEMGVYDLPATVDKIIKHTGKSQIHYVAHSQGSTIFFVMLAERPEYNEKIASAYLLAPVAFLRHIESPPLRIVAAKKDEIAILLDNLGLYELFPSTALNQLGGHLLCGPNVPTQVVCLMMTYFSVGFSEYDIDRNFFPKIFETTPAGISSKQFLHFGQLITSGRFQKFDYGSQKENYKRYRSRTPPDYNLSNIRVPLNLYSGGRDFILNRKDVYALLPKLKNSLYSLKEIPGFNHIDLLYSTEAPRLIYNEILSGTKKLYPSL